MSFIEFIGFVISIIAMIFLVGKGFFDQYRQRKNPEEYARREREKEKAIRKLLRLTNGYDVEDEVVEDVPKKKITFQANPKQMVKKQHKPKAVNRTPSSDFIERETNRFEDSLQNMDSGAPKDGINPYGVVYRQTQSRATVMLKGLPSKRQMVIFKEILDKPLSLRDIDDYKNKQL